jgi:hypothetical protein
MTYGWAILVILVIGVALWQMGVFNPASTPPGCSGFSQLMPLDSQYISSTNTLKVIVSNEAGTKLVVKSTDATIGSESQPGGFTGTMRPGVSAQIDYGPFATHRTSGEYYRAAITLEFNNTLSGIIHRSSGFCWGNAE